MKKIVYSGLFMFLPAFIVLVSPSLDAGKQLLCQLSLGSIRTVGLISIRNNEQAGNTLTYIFNPNITYWIIAIALFIIPITAICFMILRIRKLAS